MSDTSQWQEVSLENQHVWDRKSPIKGEMLEAQSNVGPNSSMMYRIKTTDGVYGVWGSTVLDNKLENVPNGAEVRIEPQGLVKSEKSGRSYQDYKVFFRDSPMKEVTDEELEMPPEWLQEEQDEEKAK